MEFILKQSQSRRSHKTYIRRESTRTKFPNYFPKYLLTIHPKKDLSFTSTNVHCVPEKHSSFVTSLASLRLRSNNNQSRSSLALSQLLSFLETASKPCTYLSTRKYLSGQIFSLRWPRSCSVTQKKNLKSPFSLLVLRPGAHM